MYQSVFAIKGNGVPWVWGRNDSGQLGTGNLTSYSSPVAMIGSHSFSILFPSITTAMGVHFDQDAWACGGNTGGELGTGNTTSYSSPVAVVGNHLFVFVNTDGDAGAGHSFGLKSSGAAWAWGTNTFGQLGSGDMVSYSSPVAVVGSHSFRQIYSAGNNAFSIALKSDGSAWAWGSNDSGQLGTGNATSYSSPVAVIGNHSFIKICTGRFTTSSAWGLKSNGSIWGWGANSVGQLGNGTVTSYSSPIAVVGSHSFIDFAVGFSHVIGLKADGSVWGWGSDSAGQLGDNTLTTVSSPVAMIGGHSFNQIMAGARISFGLKANGEIWACGFNDFGQLGHNDNITYSSPVLVVGSHSFTQLATNQNIRCYVDDAAVWHRGNIGYVNLGSSWGRVTEAWVNVGGTTWNKWA